MSVECPECMPKHRADLAQSEAWRDQHGVRCEGWLHPSRDYPELLHCNCCGRYYGRHRVVDIHLVHIPKADLWRWEPA